MEDKETTIIYIMESWERPKLPATQLFIHQEKNQDNAKKHQSSLLPTIVMKFTRGVLL